MDRSSLGGVYGSPGSGNANINIPVSSPGMVSPYMNFDPSIIGASPESQYILPEGANHRRGRFELAFAQIGGSVMLGGGLGGARGLYTGLQEASTEKLFIAKRATLLNHIGKVGAPMAQSFGVVALLYSTFGVIISKARGADDELNTLASAGLTGMLYKYGAEAKKRVAAVQTNTDMHKVLSTRQSLLRGGAVGLSLGLAFCLYNNTDRMKQIVGLH